MPAWRNMRRKAVNVVAISVFAFGVVMVAIAYGVSNSNSRQSTDTLRMVSILFRHGDRTPTETYATDPYRDPKFWPEGWGALTNKGKMQMFVLGNYFRERYNGFLSATYSPQEALIQSSANDRCLMSAEANLAGLYPPVGSQVWNPDLLWQPIPVHSTPRNLDQLIVMKKPCPAYKRELNIAYNSSEIRKINEDNSELYKYLSEHTGQTVNNITTVELLYNTLQIEDDNKLQLPVWTKEVFPVKMKMLAARSLALFSETKVMRRLNGGPLAKQITYNMLSKTKYTLKPSFKLFIYSVHDITIINVLRTFGFTKLLKPEYGASLFIELHYSTENEHEVKMLYLHNTSTAVPEQLEIPGCPSTCYLSKFVSLMEPSFPDNWDMECMK